MEYLLIGFSGKINIKFNALWGHVRVVEGFRAREKVNVCRVGGGSGKVEQRILIGSCWLLVAVWEG